MKKKINKKEGAKKEGAKKKSQGEALEIAEKNFDFGGLPERDLKKNLGC